MRCKEIKELLEAYVEGELDTSEQMEVDRHVNSCESCRRELELTRCVPKLVSALETPAVPDGIVSDALEQLRSTPRRQRRWARISEALSSRKWQIAAFASLLILISVISIGYQRMDKTSQITDEQVASAAIELRFALGIVGSATQKAQSATMMELAKAADTTKSASTNTMQILSEAQSQAYGKLKSNLSVLIRP